MCLCKIVITDACVMHVRYVWERNGRWNIWSSFSI